MEAPQQGLVYEALEAPQQGLVYETMEAPQQGLVIVFKDPTEAEDNGKFIILPKNFLREHPNVEELLRAKRICLLNEGNVSRLFVDRQRLLTFEILLEMKPQKTDFPFFVVGPGQMETIINDLFSASTVLVMRPRSAEEAARGPGQILTIINDQLPSSTFLVKKPRHSRQFARPAVNDTNLSVVKLLLANSEALTDIQWSEYEGISGSLLHLAVNRGNLALARALLEHGLDVNGGSDGCRPLDFAIRSWSRNVVQLLIDHGANIDPDEEGFTPLHRCNYRVSEVLIQNGVDVNGMSNSGVAPLHSALETREEAVEALLNYGAHLDVTTRDNESVLEKAFLRRQENVFRYLLERCFTKFDTLKDGSDLTGLISRIRGEPGADFRRPSYEQNKIDFLARHVFKIAALEDRLSDDLCRRLAELATPDSHLDEFVSKCREEVGRMASHKLADTEVSVTEFLAMNELQVARLLNNESVAQIVKSGIFNVQFPLYKMILRLHLKKGKVRQFIQAEGIKSFDALSSHFRKLPDELKDKFVSYLGLLETTRLQKASGRRQTFVLG